MITHPFTCYFVTILGQESGLANLTSSSTGIQFSGLRVPDVKIIE